MNKPKILVVDDEPLNIELVKGILSKDYDVMSASSGIEALIKTEKQLPELILLDIMMPYFNGYAVCRDLKTRNKTKAIPILMLTALKENDDKARAIESGADDFISKPIDINELRVKVKSWLSLKKLGGCNFPESPYIHLYKVF